MNVDKAGADDSVSSIDYLLPFFLTQISNSDNPVIDNTDIGNKTKLISGSIDHCSMLENYIKVHRNSSILSNYPAES